MGKETISPKTFAKGLTAGVIVAASLGMLTIGEYSIGGGSVSDEGSPANAVPEAAPSATFAEVENASAGTEAAAEAAADAETAAEEAAGTEAAAETTAGTEAPAEEAAGAEAATETAAGAAGAAVTVQSPGTYTASAKGLESDVTVTATFDEHGITEITADVSGETAGIGAEAGEPMIKKALEAQSADIDGVAGATITSTAFKTALADCMEQAGFTAAAPEAAAEAAEVSTEAPAETETAETDTAEAGAAAEEAADSETSPAAADAPFVPGTYTATADGVIVNVTFDENNILAVGTYAGADASEEDQAACLGLAQAILDAQSGDVAANGARGAAVLDAFADCVRQAHGEGSQAADGGSVTTVIGGAYGSTSIFLAGKEVSYMETEVPEAASESPDGPFAPGTYTATAAGFDGDVTVTMTFDETKIQDMEIDLSAEPSGFGGMIDDEMAARILSAQTAEVDGVSGATVTADAIKEAAAQCIGEAGASVTAVIGGADGPTSIFLAGKEVSYMETEVPEAVSESPDGPFTPGTYTATTAGFDGDIVVTMTFDETKILDMEIDLSAEPSGFGGMIDDEMLTRILREQTSEVDGVSGATVTADAIKEAAAQCIGEANASTATATGGEAETETEAETEAE